MSSNGYTVFIHRPKLHQKTTKKRVIYTVAHTYKYTELTVLHKLRLLPGTRWHFTRSNRAQRKARGKCHKNCLLQRSCFFSYLSFRLLSLSPPLSRPLYWYFSAFSLSPLSPIAAAVGFELSHFSPLHFLLSAAIICTWRMPFLIIMPDKRSRSPSSVKRMCI